MLGPDFRVLNDILKVWSLFEGHQGAIFSTRIVLVALERTDYRKERQQVGGQLGANEVLLVEYVKSLDNDIYLCL